MYSIGISTLSTALCLLPMVLLNPGDLHADESQSPRHRTVDLNIGDVVEVELTDKTIAKVKLLDVKELRDTVRKAIREAQIKIEINGSVATLVSANYRLPIIVGEVQVDCPATRGLNLSG